MVDESLCRERQRIHDERFARDKERIEDLERICDKLNRLSIEMSELVKKHDEQLSAQAQRLDSIERKPLRWWEKFDVIVSRNLTWTLPDAEHAYQEWFRVLKPGGVMINLDANYGAADFADTADLPENHAHHQIQDELMQECEDIKRQLPISSFLRPAWDLLRKALYVS